MAVGWILAKRLIQIQEIRTFLFMLSFKEAEFIDLFREFADTFLLTPEGQKHISFYENNRQTGQQNFQEVQAAVARGEDVTNLVLLKLLPHADSSSNQSRGAWTHHAPAITADLKKWYESSGDRYDWPAIAQAILSFVQSCITDPTSLKDACIEFSGLPCTKGFQVGMLTPILNALRPDEFLLVNKKPLRVINYFAGKSYTSSLITYPAVNTELRQFIQAHVPQIRQACLNVPLHEDDLFDAFCHWIVALKKYNFDVRYWKIAPGEKAWQWEECREQGFIAIGWDELGDISKLTKTKFDEKCNRLIRKHPDWTKDGTSQVWKFAQIKEGDRVVANRGTTEVLGIGTVTGAYYYDADANDQKHRLSVHWDDLTPRSISEHGWRRTLVSISLEKFKEICGNMPIPNPNCPFTSTTFELLAELHAIPKKTTYLARKDEFKQQLEAPFQKLLRQVATQLPGTIKDHMETERKIFARILKNDFNHGGAWDFYWGAFYTKGGERTKDAQLSMWINHERFEVGFFIGRYGSEQRQRFVNNCQKYYKDLVELLQDSLSDERLWFGDVTSSRNIPWKDWLRDLDSEDIDVSLCLKQEDVLGYSDTELVNLAVETYQQLFPLVLLAIYDNPLPAIVDYLNIQDDDDEPVNPVYSLAHCARTTYLEEDVLKDWVHAIHRKGQAVLYGPPGTGKTFLARHISKHLIGGGNGFLDTVQFHPAYTYEDFIQGIRPKRVEGGLDYPTVPGRFLEFCKTAQSCGDHPCVLIIDEINRANLAQVFGELMYLLEYRNDKVHLASGELFSIPKNVRIIGTMNTADRSIALVDHALRRRFAFLHVPPNYDGLRQYHVSTGYAPSKLIDLLREINTQIGDPHYEIGTSFFLRSALATEVKSIWQLEIEPYLEEFFFDQPDKMKSLRWDGVKERLIP